MNCEPLLNDQGSVVYCKSFFEPNQSTDFFKKILEETPWRQDKIKLFGKLIPIPRQQAWYGEPEATYKYSSLELTPINWTPTLLKIKRDVEEYSKTTFNSCLVNLYRDGNDYAAWHSDDEKELGKNPSIASISLGGTRRFHLKHKTIEKRIRFDLEDGSLLLMTGELQHYWSHQLSKTKKIVAPRINLTFRKVEIK